MTLQCVTLQILADYIGERATARLITAFGGSDLKIPVERCGQIWQALCDAIGPEATEILCEHFGGESLYIAMNRQDIIERNRREAHRLRQEGLNSREIARRLAYTVHYSDRGVRKLLEAYRKESERGIDLFEGVG